MHWMFLPFKRYARFGGRSRRKEYWMFVLLLTVVYSLLAGVAVTMGVSAFTSGDSALLVMLASFGKLAIFFGLFWLVTLIPSIAVVVRRLHDTDRSGWWLMLYIGPYIISTVLSITAVSNSNASLHVVSTIVSVVGLIGALVLLIFMCLDGTRGLNRFGPDPKDPSGAENLGDVFA